MSEMPAKSPQTARPATIGEGGATSAPPAANGAHIGAWTAGQHTSLHTLAVANHVPWPWVEDLGSWSWLSFQSAEDDAGHCTCRTCLVSLLWQLQYREAIPEHCNLSECWSEDVFSQVWEEIGGSELEP